MLPNIFEIGEKSFIPLIFLFIFFFILIDMLVMFLPIEMMVMMMWTSVRRETIRRFHTQQHATLRRRCWKDPRNFTLC